MWVDWEFSLQVERVFRSFSGLFTWSRKLYESRFCQQVYRVYSAIGVVLLCVAKWSLERGVQVVCFQWLSQELSCCIYIYHGFMNENHEEFATTKSFRGTGFPQIKPHSNTIPHHRKSTQHIWYQSQMVLLCPKDITGAAESWMGGHFVGRSHILWR